MYKKQKLSLLMVIKNTYRGYGFLQSFEVGGNLPCEWDRENYHGEAGKTSRAQLLPEQTHRHSYLEERVPYCVQVRCEFLAS
jgi:hypothetical protein